MYSLGFIWLPWSCIYKVLFNSFEMDPTEYRNPHQSYDSSIWIADHGNTFLFFVFGYVLPGAVWLHFCCVLFTNCIVNSCLPSRSGSWKSRLDTGKLDVYFLLNWLVLTWLHPVFRKGLAQICGAYIIKNSHLWEESFTACLWGKTLYWLKKCFSLPFIRPSLRGTQGSSDILLCIKDCSACNKAWLAATEKWRQPHSWLGTLNENFSK